MTMSIFPRLSFLLPLFLCWGTKKTFIVSEVVFMGVRNFVETPPCAAEFTFESKRTWKGPIQGPLPPRLISSETTKGFISNHEEISLMTASENQSTSEVQWSPPLPVNLKDIQPRYGQWCTINGDHLALFCGTFVSWPVAVGSSQSQTQHITHLKFELTTIQLMYGPNSRQYNAHDTDTETSKQRKKIRFFVSVWRSILTSHNLLGKYTKVCSTFHDSA